jgi:hypothetical protein
VETKTWVAVLSKALFPSISMLEIPLIYDIPEAPYFCIKE